MSAQRLNGRSTRRIANATHLDILRAWSYGGYTHEFVTTDHQHGWYDTKTGEHGFDTDPIHYTSCHELFPNWDHA